MGKVAFFSVREDDSMFEFQRYDWTQGCQQIDSSEHNFNGVSTSFGLLCLWLVYGNLYVSID